MKTVSNETLGFKFQISVPDSAAEFDRLAGKEGACVDEANKNVIYRSWNAEFRKKAVEAIEKSTGIERKVTGYGPNKKDGSQGAAIYEADTKYMERVLAEGSGHSIASLTPLVTEIANAIEFDPSAAERGGRAVGKEYLEMADGVIGRGADAANAVVEKLRGLNPTFGEVERDEAGLPKRESLGALIKANTIRKASEDLA